MVGSRFFAWGLLALWSTWLFALQGFLASQGGVAAWLPDMGILILLMMDGRSSTRSMLLAVCLVSCARIGFSADPPLAIFFGYALLVSCMQVLRRVLEVDQPVIRALLAGLGFLAINKYWSLARNIALAGGQGQIDSAIWTRDLPAASWSMALATGLSILLLGSALMHLPGLTPLRRGDR